MVAQCILIISVMNHYTKIFIILLFTFGLSLNKTQAQSELEEGNMLISVSYGVPSFAKLGLLKLYKDYNSHYNYKAKALLGPLSLKFEYLAFDKLGVGLSTNLAKASVTYDYGNGHFYTETLTKWNILSRSNYHFYAADNIDLYAGAGVGYNAEKRVRTTAPTDDPSYIKNGDHPLKPEYSHVTGEITLGMLYMFSDNFGAFGELGVSKSLLQVGVFLKL